MKAWLFPIFLGLAVCLVDAKTGHARADGPPVDLLLVLAADVSRSVDEREFRLQRDGYASAISDPRVIEAISTGPHGRIGVMYLEWSGITSQRVLIDWRTIANLEDAKRFGEELSFAPRPFMDRTAIGSAIEFSMQQLDRSPFASERKVIDISGDGTNTNGRHVSVARDAAIAKGLTINGLVILSDVPLPWNPEHTHPPGGLRNYYEENVIGGPSAFTMVAEGFETFGYAIINKLIKEIAALPRCEPAAAEPVKLALLGR